MRKKVTSLYSIRSIYRLLQSCTARLLICLALVDGSIDLICMDPPYYDNVQYGELSDYFYVWQRRTLADLYPDLFTRRLVDKDQRSGGQPCARRLRASGQSHLSADDGRNLRRMSTGPEG